jgi:hypothetical protein
MVASTTAIPITGCQSRTATLIPSATWVSHGVRIAAGIRSSQVLRWSPARRQGVSSAARNPPPTVTTTSSSHAVVVTVIRRGSGGGAPVGRRCRLVLRTVPAGGGLTVASLTAPPAPRPGATAGPPPARPRDGR